MLIIAAKSGQLGNRLLLFANFIAWAIEHNFTVLNPAFEEYAEFFTGTANNLLCCYPAPYCTTPANRFLRSKYYKFIKYWSDRQLLKTQEITREKPFSWTSYRETEKLDRASIVCFKGWLFRDGWFVEDLPLLRKHAAPIRSYFTPTYTYRINASNLISNLKNSADIIVGIHIRQGDYDRHQNGRYFYPIEQYIAVMNAAAKLFTGNKIKFLICSNVKQEPELFQDFNFVFGSGHFIEDLHALSECDYLIGPPSSYTMWAAFYGEKPLYMMRDARNAISLKDFVHFYEWQGVFNYRDNWSESFWDWTH